MQIFHTPFVNLYTPDGANSSNASPGPLKKSDTKDLHQISDADYIVSQLKNSEFKYFDKSKKLAEMIRNSKDFDPNQPDMHGDLPLHIIIDSDETCDKDLIQALADRGADFNATDRYGETALLKIAAKNFAWKSWLIPVLVKNGADVNERQFRSCATPLCLSVMAHDSIGGGNPSSRFWEESRNTFKKLVDSGADINKGFVNDDTPLLHHFAQYNNLEMVKYLLKQGADPNLLDRHGYTPLQIARLCKKDEMVDLLKSLGSQDGLQTRNGQSDLTMAAINNDTELASRLMKDRKDYEETDDNGEKALVMACRHKSTEVAKILLESGANPNYKLRGLPAIYYSAYDSELMSLLLEKGANPNPSEELISPLANAVRSGNASSVKVLLKHGATPKDKDDIYFWARNADVLQTLLEHDVPFDLSYHSSFSLIDHYIQNGQAEIAELLIDKGFDINAKGPQGQTFLNDACGEDHLETIKFLINKGLDINAADNHGRRPWEHSLGGFGLAAFALDTVKFLLKSGANFDLIKDGTAKQVRLRVNNGGNLEINKDTFELLQLYLQNEGDVNKLDENGFTPLTSVLKQEEDIFPKAISLLHAGANLYPKNMPPGMSPKDIIKQRFDNHGSIMYDLQKHWRE